MPSKVSNLRVKKSTSTSLEVEWNPPENIFGILQGYTVWYVIFLKKLTSFRIFLVLNNPPPCLELRSVKTYKLVSRWSIVWRRLNLLKWAVKKVFKGAATSVAWNHIQNMMFEWLSVIKYLTRLRPKRLQRKLKVRVTFFCSFGCFFVPSPSKTF